MSNRTICLINDSFPPVTDGVANAVVNYGRAITESGSRAVVATPAYPGADDSGFSFPVVRYPSIDMTKLVGYHAGLPFSEKTMQTLMEYPFDLIRLHFVSNVRNSDNKTLYKCLFIQWMLFFLFIKKSFVILKEMYKRLYEIIRFN